MHRYEKMRLAAIRKDAATLGIKGQDRYFRSIALLDAARKKRCMAVIRKGRIPIYAGDYIYAYYPSTGKVVWMVHSINTKIGENALVSKQNGRSFTLLNEKGEQVSAARIIFAAVHGEIPEEHDVYCVNGDNSDLTILNLRSHYDNGKSKMREWNKTMREM